MGNRHNLALIQTHWGRLYQSLVRRVMEGSWKQEDQGSSAVNYWWGMEQGVVSVLCSRRLPTGPRRLAGVLREALKADRLDPFYGVLDGAERPGGLWRRRPHARRPHSVHELAAHLGGGPASPNLKNLQKKLRSSSSSRVWSGRASHEDLSYF